MKTAHIIINISFFLSCQASERPMAATMAEHVQATSFAILIIALFSSAQFSMSTCGGIRTSGRLHRRHQ
ncbi:hypothetical protein T4B_12311 [Trichinella pseudospiralis]|uniref:Uncharacterized protein n=1 Tax=Trichinella pseudospiralis TaxID=6337 RepID=A0A0V1GE53_TRIPS|nr:hypothetical protein T4B_12311 [Trichinella pseudospiralis]